MGSEFGRDVARQMMNVIGALFQVGATIVASTRIQEVVDSDPRSLVEPAGYAFTIWALIFALSLTYAVYQALPINRDNVLLRRIGWLTAGAFFCTGLWSVFVPAQQLVLAQVMLLAIFACLLIAYLRLARFAGGGAPSSGERWLVALLVGIFFGWITAANAVSLTSEAVRFGLVDSGGAGEALLGGILLLLGGMLAAVVVLAGKTGSPQGYLAYAATVLWALAGVVVNQYDASIATAGAAAVAVVLVVLSLLGRLPAGTPEVGPPSPTSPSKGVRSTG